MVSQKSRSMGNLPRIERARHHPTIWFLFSLTLAITATASGASVDGDQWVDVVVTNTTTGGVTLDTHPQRHLAPGQKTVLHVNTNNDPQTLQVRTDSDAALGCLTFDTRPAGDAARSQSIDDLTPCPQDARPFPG